MSVPPLGRRLVDDRLADGLPRSSWALATCRLRYVRARSLNARVGSSYAMATAWSSACIVKSVYVRVCSLLGPAIVWPLIVRPGRRLSRPVAVLDRFGVQFSQGGVLDLVT